MGLRGPAPMPTAIRKATGNLGRRPFPANEPKYPPGAPDKPPGMSAGARKIWDALVVKMHGSGVLTLVDGLSLARLCENISMRDRLSKSWEKAGLETERAAKDSLKAAMATYKPEAELPKPRLGMYLPGGDGLSTFLMTPPGKRLANQINALNATINVQEREFGITPSSRSRVSAAGAGPVDEFDKALSVRKISA